jgi:hypothetical protein
MSHAVLLAMAGDSRSSTALLKLVQARKKKSMDFPLHAAKLKESPARYEYLTQDEFRISYNDWF